MTKPGRGHVFMGLQAGNTARSKGITYYQNCPSGARMPFIVLAGAGR